MFKFNHALDKTIFKPIAKGYRALPAPIRKGTGNAFDNLRSLLTLSNNVLQGEFGSAGNTAARFGINTTAGILGIFDPASKLGFEDRGKEDFGQTMGLSRSCWMRVKLTAVRGAGSYADVMTICVENTAV